MIFLAFFSYTKLSFMEKKIDQNLNYTMSGQIDNKARNRFIGGYLDLKELSQNPLFGIGIQNPNNSYALKYVFNHRNNGDTDFAKQFGLIIFIIFFYAIYKSFLSLCFINNSNIYFSVIAIVTILITGFSELYFTRPVFISLVFINFLYFDKFPSKKRIEDFNSTVMINELYKGLSDN